jgi:hypothetical protein
MGINAYIVRASEALDAGQTDFSGQAALAAVGDALPLNITGIYEGVTGRSIVTDRALGTERRSAVVGGLFGGAALGPLGSSLGRVGAKLGKRLPGSSPRATHLEAVTSTVPVAQQPRLLPAGKEPKLLPAGAHTTLTIEEVAQLQGSGRQRGKAFEQWTIEANRGWKPRGARVAGGMRYHDAAESITTRIEAKNYWEPVPLNDFIRRQVRKDVDWLREGLARGERRWVRWEFAGAGPSPELAAYLQRWAPEGISAIVYGANQ